MEKLFLSYHWPGNIRELSNVVLRLVIGESPDCIRAELVNNMRDDNPMATEDAAADFSSVSSETEPYGGWMELLSSLGELKAEGTRYIERKLIIRALKMTGGNKRKASEMLQISYKSLFNKLNEYEIGIK